MAPASEEPETARHVFRSLRLLRDELLSANLDPRIGSELSMGMSGDFEIAIEEGATMIRVRKRSVRRSLSCHSAIRCEIARTFACHTGRIRSKHIEHGCNRLGHRRISFMLERFFEDGRLSFS